MSVLQLTFHSPYLSDYAGSTVLGTKFKFQSPKLIWEWLLMTSTKLVIVGVTFFLRCHQGLYQGVKDTGFFLPQMQDYWRHQIKVWRRGNKVFSFFFLIFKNLDTLLWSCLFISSFQCFFLSLFLPNLFV